MRNFGKYDRDFGTNAKLAAAGRDAVLVLLELQAQWDRDPTSSGVVSPSRASDRQLAILLAGLRFTAAEVASAKSALDNAGLIDLYSDGSVGLPNVSEWGTSPVTRDAVTSRDAVTTCKGGTPLSQAERARRYREKHRNAGQDAAKPSRHVTETVTSRHVTQERDSTDVHTHTPRDVTQRDAEARGGGGDPDPKPQTQTRPRTGAGNLDAALAGLGIAALDDQVARHEIATALATEGITAAELGVLDKCARKSGSAHDGSEGRGLLLSWLRSPERCRDQLRAYEKRNPPLTNGADREGPVVIADGEARYAERRAKVGELAAALGDLELDALDRPARLRAVAESLVDTELTTNDVRRLERHAGALAAKSPDPDSDPGGRVLLGHWLSDVRVARDIVAGLELGEPPPKRDDPFGDLGPIFGEERA